MAIEHADFDGIERLALVTGGEIVSTFDHPEMVKLGKCELIEQVGQPYSLRPYQTPPNVYIPGSVGIKRSNIFSYGTSHVRSKENS